MATQPDMAADKGWGSYYHFTYATYPKGTKLPTFTRNLTAKETAAGEDGRESGS